MLRNSLSSISLNRRVRRQYNIYKRELICKTVASEIILYRIQKNYEVPEFFIRNIVLNVLIRHNLDFKSRSERFRKLITRDEQYIRWIIRRNSKIIYKNLIAETKVHINHNIIYRMLKEKEIINWLIKKRFLFTSEMTDKRYQWAIEHENWK